MPNSNPHVMQGTRETAPEWAQIEATRAVAFEQARIADALELANLIAVMSHSAKMGSFDIADAIAKTVSERLNLA